MPGDLGWTALLEAVILGDGSRRYVHIIDVLLDAGADRTLADRDGVTALEHAEPLATPRSPLCCGSDR